MAKLKTDPDPAKDLAPKVKVRSQRTQSRLDDRAALAAREDDVEAMRSALAAGADPNHCVPVGGPLLRVAADRSHAEMIQALIEGGADPEGLKAGSPHEGGALYRAAFWGSAECVAALLAAGA